MQRYSFPGYSDHCGGLLYGSPCQSRAIPAAAAALVSMQIGPHAPAPQHNRNEPEDVYQQEASTCFKDILCMWLFSERLHVSLWYMHKCSPNSRCCNPFEARVYTCVRISMYIYIYVYICISIYQSIYLSTYLSTWSLSGRRNLACAKGGRRRSHPVLVLGEADKGWPRLWQLRDARETQRVQLYIVEFRSTNITQRAQCGLI